MSVLITADLHLTDNPRDAYRWDVFVKLRSTIEAHRVKVVVIAGDLTHHKDNHTNALINRLVDELNLLAGMAEVILLKGNHDFTDPSYPLLKLTRLIEGITFIDEPCPIRIEKRRWTFLPYTQDYETDWADLGKADVVCFHQPIEGAVASGGHSIAGVPASAFDRFKAKLLIGGDIHKPQRIGNIEYVGSPHPVSAGEDHAPRFLIVAGTAVTEIELKTIKRSTLKMRRIKPLSKLGIKRGDQVRIKVELPASRQGRWAEYRDKIKADAEASGVILLGLEMAPLDRQLQLPDRHAKATRPIEVLMEFVRKQEVPEDLVAIGEDLLNQAQGKS